MDGTYSFKWGYYITVYDSPYPYTVLEYYKWENLSFELFIKYKWYFEYRYALLRIKYPKFRIEHNQLKRDLNQKEKKSLFENRLIGKKRTLTKYRNALKLFEKNWSSLFPIMEDEQYQMALVKISRVENELKEMELNLKKL